MRCVVIHRHCAKAITKLTRSLTHLGRGLISLFRLCIETPWLSHTRMEYPNCSPYSLRLHPCTAIFCTWFWGWRKEWLHLLCNRVVLRQMKSARIPYNAQTHVQTGTLKHEGATITMILCPQWRLIQVLGKPYKRNLLVYYRVFELAHFNFNDRLPNLVLCTLGNEADTQMALLVLSSWMSLNMCQWTWPV